MFNRVLIGVDGRKGGRDAVTLAVQLAAPGATLTLGHVYGTGLVSGRGAALLREEELMESERLLERERGFAWVDSHVVPHAEHSVGHGLHELAERLEADLLVVGSCRRGLLGRALLGNDTADAVNGSSCAVAVAPARYTWTAHQFTLIGVGCDGSPESEHALAAARGLAARHGAKIKPLWVVSLENVQEGKPVPANWPAEIDELLEECCNRLGGQSDVYAAARYGGPREELARVGQDLDLLIVGSRGHGAIGRLFHRSVSSYLLRHAPCPLLVLPHSAVKASEPSAAERETATAPIT